MKAPLDQWRPHFPILDTCTYLASHSLGAVPNATAHSLQAYFDQWATQGILAWDGPWWQIVEEFSALIEQLLGAKPHTVVPMQNATRAMAAVASCLDYSGPRNRIVLTSMEFTTSYPFWLSQKKLGAEVTIVESSDGITIDTQALIDAIDERTLLVPTSHVYFRSGAVQNLQAVVEAAHKHGAMVLGDGYQALGTVPVNVQDLGIDFYVGGSHKWLCGGPGAAYLYVHPDRIQSMEPRMTGWFGLQNPFDYEPERSAPQLADGVFRFLGGTPNVPALFAAKEGVSIVNQIGSEAIREKSTAQTAGIIAQADARGLEVRTPRQPERRSGMVCVHFSGAQAVTNRLCDQSIVVDWRPDCGLRLSPHFYNSDGDLSHFWSALDEARQQETVA